MMLGIESAFVAVFAGHEPFEDSYNHPSSAQLGLMTSAFPICAVGILFVQYTNRYVGSVY